MISRMRRFSKIQDRARKLLQPSLYFRILHRCLNNTSGQVVKVHQKWSSIDSNVMNIENQKK